MDIPDSAWPLIRLAVDFSQEAYKVTVLSSAQQYTAVKRVFVSKRAVHPYGEVVVIAVCGTKSFRDWIVNLNNRACRSEDVLGKQPNLCHAGFLDALKSLIKPLAMALAKHRESSTLLFTGHSAGAALASLLFSHIRSEAKSSLATAAVSFKNVHCIVFGCPPISVNPLQSHERKEASFSSLFFSFLNEGDPIIKADAGYIAKRYGWRLSARSVLRSSKEVWHGQGIDVLARPSNRFFVHSGSVFLLEMDAISPLGSTIVRTVDNGELDEDTPMSWRVHGIGVYRERIESYWASLQKIDHELYGGDASRVHVGDVCTRAYVEQVMIGWPNVMFF